MENVKKICISLIICTLLISAFCVNSYAEFDWKSKINEAAAKPGDSSVTEPVTKISGSIVTITRVVCVGVAITMLIVLAMKYMSAAPGDKATIKKSAVTYVVGAVIMFAASGILGIIQNFSKVIN